jgi:hypothetical protein
VDTELEDNLYTYYFTFQWIASSRTFRVFGGAEGNCLILSANITASQQDATTFVWGFQAETGGANNYQSVGDIKYNFRTALSATDSDTSFTLDGTTNIASAPSDGVGSVYDLGTAWTAEAWINPTSACATNLCNFIAKEYSLLLRTTGNEVYFITGNGTGWNGGWVLAGGFVPYGSWSHVAATYSGTTITIYLNGRAIYSNASAAAAGVNSERFNVGARTVLANPGTIYERFQGQIDEVRLWNTARSQSNISSGMHSRPSLSDSNLRAYFDFNESSGADVINRVTNSLPKNDLVISGTVSRTDVKEVSTSGIYTIVKFPRSYIQQSGGWTVPTGVRKVNAVLVAGGGGGSAETDGTGWMSGGGGAGGYLYFTADVSPSRSETVTVGYGGHGGAAVVPQNVDGKRPTQGQNSVFLSQTAFGGGLGGGNWTSGAAGGSGGGGGTYSGSGGNGTAGQGNNGGAAWSSCCSSGGGGGAGGQGGTGTNANGGAAGDGVLNPIYIDGFTPQYLAAGGAGGSLYGSLGNAGTKGGTEFSTNAVANSGSGGGGGGGWKSPSGNYNAGYGGSGIIVIRYITASAPIFTGPTFDTLTAGLTETFTVTGSANSPLTRGFRWQVSTDTGTSWTNASTGSGFLTSNYVTPILETNTSGIRYQYRVVVTDSDSAGLFIVDTSTAVFLTINPPITFTSLTSTIAQKYGAGATTRTVTFTGGTDTRTVSASSLSLASGRITFDTATARFTIDTRTAVGTYSSTITITDAKGATASYVQTITLAVADTLTVTSDTSTVTYTGIAANFNPTISAVSGLVTGDVISGATFNYSASAATCAQGGLCSIGQTGPGGGLVFITPTTVGNNTGRYFEAAPAGWSGSATDPLARLCTSATSVAGASGTAIGTGETNTNLFAASTACGASAADTATALVLNGRDDWFLPSFDELKEMYSKLHKAASGALGGFNTASNADNYLSSSDNPSGPFTDFGAGYALYGWFGSSNGVAGWGSTSKTQPWAYRPVRSFLATSTSTVNYGPSTTKPTNAATYTITPSALTFSSGALSNYAAVTYQTSTLTINKAAQAALSVVPLYNVFNGNPTTSTLSTTGGSDTGTVTYAYVSSGSTAGGCALSGADSSTVTVTSAGTCRIVATKAATNNFLVAISDTGTVTFYLYVTNIPAPRPAEYPAEIVLSGSTAMTNNGLAPTITFTGADISAAPGALFIISGSGFVGTRLVRVSGVSAVFTVLSDTSLRITMPAGLTGVSGPIYIEKAEGSRASEDWVVGTA